MLFRRDILDGIVEGRIDRVYRTWTRPMARAGGRQRTQIGLIEFVSVERVDLESLTETDAERSGFRSLERLVAAQTGNAAKVGDGDLYRIGVRYGGADPRIALRKDADLDADARAAITARLDRLDAASPRGAWTRATLRLIAGNEAVRAPDLAASVGVETQAWKRDVRKLKELGLTESLDVGYRLSPRGEALLARWRAQESHRP